MLSNILLVFIIALTISYILTPFTIKLSERFHILDGADEKRKKQKKPMPTIGGLAVYTSFLISSIFFFLMIIYQNKIDLSFFVENNFEIVWKLGAILLSSMVLFIVSFIDDKRKVKASIKFMVQSIAAIIVILVGIRIDRINIPIINKYYFFSEIFSIILTYFWIVGVTNAINLIDGLDGLSSGVIIISSICMLAIFVLNNSSILSIIILTSLAGATAGFYPHNRYPASTYIGDCGTQTIGFLLSIVAIIGTSKTYTFLILLVPIFALIIPIFDTLSVFLRRFIKGGFKAIFIADDRHLHHRLLKTISSVEKTVFFIHFLTAIFGILGIFIFEAGILKTIAYIIVASILLFFVTLNVVLDKNKTIKVIKMIIKDKKVYDRLKAIKRFKEVCNKEKEIKEDEV